jgi:hypothetical protein
MTVLQSFGLLQPGPKLREYGGGGLKSCAVDARRRRGRPWLLQAHRRLEQRASLLRQRLQLGALVVRVGLKFDDAGLCKLGRLVTTPWYTANAVALYDGNHLR